MSQKREHFYTVYKGDEFVECGTLEELKEWFGPAWDTLKETGHTIHPVGYMTKGEMDGEPSA